MVDNHFEIVPKKIDYVLDISNKAFLIGSQIERVSQWVIGEIKSLKGFVM